MNDLDDDFFEATFKVSPKDKFYYDIDCNTHDFYKVMTIASYWTLTAGVASDEQAHYLIEKILHVLFY